MGIERFSVGEWRRREGLHLRELGLRQRDIAIALEVSEGAVSQWLKAFRLGGEEAFNDRSRSGRPSKLSAEQKALIPDFLWHGAEAYGFRGEVWTCPRVAAVLAEELGVRYSRSQVSRLLKQLGWTPQVSLIRAIQRDEVAIERWRVEVWPEVKKRAKQEHRTLVFIDESGFYLLPGVIKTYGPRSSTPVPREWQMRDHLSVMGAVTPPGKIYSLVRQEPLNDLHSVAFLRHLLCVARERLVVIWDRSPIPRRAAVQEFLATEGSGHVHIEPLPPYAPDLNPVEWKCRHLKEVELCNLACLDLEELHMEFHLALECVRRKPYLVPSFFAGARLAV